MKPEELLYAPTHEWVFLADGPDGKIATLGVSAFAVEQLSDLVFIDFPEVGQTLEAGASFGEIESVKSVSDLYTPVAGEVLEVNSGLADALDTINDDPHGAGWLIKIKVSDDAGLANLLDFAAYQKQCQEAQ